MTDVGENPYRSPESPEGIPQPRNPETDGNKRARCFVRWVVCAHLLAIAGGVLLSYIDTHGMYSGIPMIIATVAIWPVVLALWTCPILVLGSVFGGRLSPTEGAIALLVEIVLIFVQLAAMLPLV